MSEPEANIYEYLTGNIPKPSSPKPKRKRRSFDFLVKRKLVEDLRQSNLYRISQRSSVGRTSLLLWRRQEEKIKNAQTLFRKNLSSKPRQSKGVYKDAEKTVFDWVIASREQGLPFFLYVGFTVYSMPIDFFTNFLLTKPKV
jgi:hypothetical protein